MTNSQWTTTRIVRIVWSCLLVSGGCFLANPTTVAGSDYEAASKEAQRLFATPEGHEYVMKFMHDIAKPVMTALGICNCDPAAKEMASDTVFVVAADGRIRRVLSKKDNAFARCIASKLQPPEIAAPPPRDSWPIQIHVLNREPSSWQPRGSDFPALTMGSAPKKGATEPISEPPKDQPLRITSPEQTIAFAKAIAPYIKKGKATYPSAKKRFLAGLPPGHQFSVKKRLQDKGGNIEDSFIGVEAISGGQITGVIQSELGAVKDYITGQRITFSETEVMDWVIVRPDGSEEGNFVGKFMDTLPR